LNSEMIWIMVKKSMLNCEMIVKCLVKYGKK